MTWGTSIEQEIRRRIQVSVAAYAYEFENLSIMPDGVWDMLAQRIDPTQGTCHPELDEFFASKFSPMTGMWIHDHPDLPGIKRTFDRYYAATRDVFDQLGKKARRA